MLKHRGQSSNMELMTPGDLSHFFMENAIETM